MDTLTHGARVRLSILEQASRIIAAAGLEPCTFRRVGAELGMSGNAIFYHFKSREGLLNAVFYYAVRNGDARCLARYVAANHPAAANLSRKDRAGLLAALV